MPQASPHFGKPRVVGVGIIKQPMKQPVSIYSSWTKSIPQIVVTAVLAFAAMTWLPYDSVTVALVTSLSIFFTYTYLIRYFVAAAHRRGMTALSKREFDTAIVEFENSFTFFSKNKWLDEYSSIMFMSSSVWSYREMALMNIAATYSMKKDTKMYRVANERLLSEYPDNQRAKDALEFLDALKNEG